MKEEDRLWYNRTVLEHLTHFTNIESSKPATSTGRAKMVKSRRRTECGPAAQW